MDQRMSPPDPEHDLEQSLRRDADGIRPTAGTGFVARVRAAREAVDAAAAEPLEARLVREAGSIRPTATPGFADRVHAARLTQDAPIPFPTRRRALDHRWTWATAAAAALLVAAAWLATRPTGTGGEDARQIAADPPTSSGPTAEPIAAPVDMPNPDLDLAILFASPVDPLDAEAAAIGADLRQTGDFLLACLPGYPGPTPAP